ncbi:MAG: hypothetical protein Q8O40_14200 [Chloroflexota bacterium]|nr:hypothetical protein [Chloroflexota bacterium]
MMKVEWWEDSRFAPDDIPTMAELETGKVVWRGPRTTAFMCDFCSSGSNQEEPTAVLPSLVIIMEVLAERVIQQPPWALCRLCREALGLKPGDTEVDFPRVKARFLVTMSGQQSPLMRRAGKRGLLKYHLMDAEGEGARA